MKEKRRQTIHVPGLEPVSLALPDSLEALRNKARDNHADDFPHWDPLPSVVAAEAKAWQAQGRQEDRQLWCARRFSIRLNTMALELEDGELVVGKPLIRRHSAADTTEIENARTTVPDLPECPGGDRGHFHPNYEKVFPLGVGGILDLVAEYRVTASEQKRDFYDACELALRGFQSYIYRVAHACREKPSRNDTDQWNATADMCERLAIEPPATFHEACQLMYFVFIGSWAGEDHIMTCFGRMDRTLRPFYESDIRAGRIDPQRAMHLIAAMFIQVNRICPAGLADAVMVGGRDADGCDATNELTYLCLVARRATWLRNPSVGIAWHEGTPEELMAFAMEMLSSGINCPAFFNDELISAGLRDHGVSAGDSCNYMNSTCVEIKPAGMSNIWVATEYVNCPKALLEAMRMEVDSECPPARNLEDLEHRVKQILSQQVSHTAQQLDELWNKRGKTWAMPFASCLVDDCLERGMDHDRDGCRYQWAENSFVGLANLADGLVAINELVFRNGEISMAQFYSVCRDNFEGKEDLRQRIITRLASYGNDDEYADTIAARWGDALCSMTERCRVGGHRYVPGFFCSQFHAWLGSMTGATPDGRLAGTALANGAGAFQGREFAGPTASALSTTKWSHRRALGGLVHNVRFSGSLLATSEGMKSARAVIETYLRRGGFQIQVNVLSADTLRAAKERPDEYRDLLVRVAGYTNYFTLLRPELQDDVIARTEHGA
jgi:pyruvate-formate lyase